MISGCGGGGDQKNGGDFCEKRLINQLIDVRFSW